MIRKSFELPGVLLKQRLSAESLRAFQDSKLRAVINHAWKRVPYYQQLFQSAGLFPKDIQTIDDLKRLPITTKEDLKRAGLENIIVTGVSPASCHRISTSGSTGQPFTVYLALRDLRTRQLVEFRTLLSIGFRPWDRLSVLGPETPHAIRFHERFGFYRSENISALLPAAEQIRLLGKTRPTILWAYPTVLRALIHWQETRLRSILRPRILITSAECMDEVLKEKIRSIWKDIEIFNFYGTAELGRIAAECPEHQGLHVNADHLIVELPKDNNTAGSKEKSGVIVTALNAFAMPFIRYHLGDISKWIDVRCACGSSFPLMHPIQGREDEMVELPGGRLLSPFGLQFILRRFHEIDQFRFVQRDPSCLLVRVALRESLSQDALSKIRADCLRYLGASMNVEIEIAPFLEEYGKFRTFINLRKQTDISIP